MYGKITRSIAKLILMMGLAAVLTGLLGLTSPAQASDTGDTITINGDIEDVKSIGGKFVGKSKKVKACKAYAEKLELPAPPRDPMAECKGKIKVKLYGKVVVSCPTGYAGAKATSMVSMRQMLWGRAFAQAMASGRAWARAELKLKEKAKIKGKVRVDCVLIPVVTPPPPPPPPPTCESHPEMPECIKTPPPVTASVSCKLPPHMYFPNGNGLVFCQASKSDGSAVKLSEFSLVGDEYAHISQVETTQYADDANTPCPSGETCFRGQVWADKVGFADFVATVLKAEWRGRMEVKADEF